MKEEIIEKLEQMRELLEEEVKIYNKKIQLGEDILDLVKRYSPLAQSPRDN